MKELAQVVGGVFQDVSHSPQMANELVELLFVARESGSKWLRKLDHLL